MHSPQNHPRRAPERNPIEDSSYGTSVLTRLNPTLLRVYVRACERASMQACKRASVRACLRACVPACLRACLRACLHACLRACLGACLRACLRTCMSCGSEAGRRSGEEKVLAGCLMDALQLLQLLPEPVGRRRMQCGHLSAGAKQAGATCTGRQAHWQAGATSRRAGRQARGHADWAGRQKTQIDLMAHHSFSAESLAASVA